MGRWSYLLLFLLTDAFTIKSHAQSPVLVHSNLPIIIITTSNSVPVPGKDSNAVIGTMKIINNGPGKLNYVTDPPNNYNGNISIKVRGNSSSYYPQRPYAVTTVDALGDDQDVSLLGMPADEDWVLISLYNDRSFIRNLLAYKMSSDMGHYTSRSSLCEVILNGSYAGVYLFGEKITQGANRINITKMGAATASGVALTGGYIFKVDSWDDSTEIWTSDYPPLDAPSKTLSFCYEYPKSTKITQPQKDYLKSFVDSFQAVMNSPLAFDSVEGYKKYIDPITFADYAIVNEASRNVDGFKKSYYFYKDIDSKDRHIKNLPVWDFDWAFKNIDNSTYFDATDGSGWSYKINTVPDQEVNSPGWMTALMGDCTFVNLFYQRYHNFRDNIISNQTLAGYIDSMTVVLQSDSAAYRHFRQWNTLGVQGPTPIVGTPPATFEGEISYLKNWLNTRLQWLDDNIPYCRAGAIIDSTMLSIYPNPASGSFHIDFESPGVVVQNLELMIYDVTGRLRYTRDAPYNRLETITIPDLQPGCYIVKLFVKDDRQQIINRYTRKLVIK